MKYKCLIVDDEAPAHRVITSHISKTDNLEISGAVFNGKEALDFMLNNKVDIVFLDIEMPKLSGLDLLECLPYKPLVILTTAYNNFGFEAYQKDVVDYLLKPIPYPRFLKAVNKALTNLLPVTVPDTYPDIEVKYDGALRKINTESIVYIEAVGNYIKLVFEKEKPVIIQQTMKFAESFLPEKYFIRIHKSYIIKKASIASKTKIEVRLTNNKTLPLGRKYSILLEAL
jgi:two-component system, LytTR family, response regulator